MTEHLGSLASQPDQASPVPPSRVRDLLTALALCVDLPRDAACKLGHRLGAWIDLAPRDAPEVASSLGVSRKSLRRALDLRAEAAEAAKEARRVARDLDVSLVTAEDAVYPIELFDLDLPPVALWIRGRIPPEPRVAIVGSRKMSHSGRRAARLFARELADAGIPTVSGFARGVDTEAHEATLSIPGGSTVAVLGCGIDVDYPSRTRSRAERIASCGALISELPPGTVPRAAFFPQRNRLIAALSCATLVVQAARRSGSLVTARHALELGRDIWAIPGDIFEPTSSGTNALIADGAFVAARPRDLLEGLSFVDPRFRIEREDTTDPTPSDAPGKAVTEPRPRKGPGGLGDQILGHCRSEGPRTAEEIAESVQIEVPAALSLLLDLELDGWLFREPGPRWRA